MNPKSFSYIDIHAHLNFAAFDADREATIRRALDAGVAHINVGTQKDTSRKAVEIAEKSLLPTCPPKPRRRWETAVLPLQKGESCIGGVYATVGLHPIHTSKSFHDKQELGEIGAHPLPTSPSKEGEGFVSRGEEFDFDYYKKLAEHPKVVGIGECGLDYYADRRGLDADKTRKQELVFRKQIELAIEVKKPLMLHLRNGSYRSAYNDAFSILNSYFSIHNSTPRGNLHFFAGSIEEARPFLDAGFTFSFTGVVTFAKEYEAIIKYLPLDAILSETDSPYVAPAPYRGKRNEPLYVREVVKAIARIRNEDEEMVRAQLLKNAERIFNISLIA